MKLSSTIIRPGELFIIRGAAPKTTDFSPQYILIGKYRLPAFVDGSDLVTRCSKDIVKGSYPVTVNGAELGRVVVDGG